MSLNPNTKKPYHISPTTQISPFGYTDNVSKNCWMTGKQCRPWSDATCVDLGLHCSLRPVSPNSYAYSMITILYAEVVGFALSSLRSLPRRKEEKMLQQVSKQFSIWRKNARLSFVFSSPEHEVLMVSYCRQSMSVIRRPSCVVRRAASTTALKAYSSYTLGPIDLILGRKHQGDL